MSEWSTEAMVRLNEKGWEGRKEGTLGCLGSKGMTGGSFAVGLGGDY